MLFTLTKNILNSYVLQKKKKRKYFLIHFRRDIFRARRLYLKKKN